MRRRLRGAALGRERSLLRSPGHLALVRRLPQLSLLLAGIAADALLLLLALLMSIPMGNVTEALWWHCWWVHLGQPVVELPLIRGWWLRLQTKRERKDSKLMPLWAVSILEQLARAQGLLPRGLTVFAFACEGLTINKPAMCTN